MGTTNFGTCGLGCNSLPSYVQTEQSPSPVASEALHIRGPRPIPVTNAFVKFFLNGMNRGMGDANGKRRLQPVQPAVERNVSESRSNLDFCGIVRTCLLRTSGFSSCPCLRSTLQCLGILEDRVLPSHCLFIIGSKVLLWESLSAQAKIHAH
jgi:hypothetical protein